MLRGALGTDGFRRPHIGLKETHPLHFKPEDVVTAPHSLERRIDLNQTTFLRHLIRRWGKLGLSFLSGADIRHHRYGFLGLEGLVHVPHPPSRFETRQLRSLQVYEK